MKNRSIHTRQPVKIAISQLKDFSLKKEILCRLNFISQKYNLLKNSTITCFLKKTFFTLPSIIPASSSRRGFVKRQLPPVIAADEIIQILQASGKNLLQFFIILDCFLHLEKQTKNIRFIN